MFVMDIKYLYLVINIVFVANGKYLQEMTMVNAQNGGFEWKNCNNTPVPMYFSSISFQPDPIIPGADMNASFVAEVTEDIGTTNTLRADIELTLTTQGTRIDICSYHPYSDYCHVDNVCKMLEQHRQKCQTMIQIFGIDCKCPLKKNTYRMPTVKYYLPKVPVEGMFHIKLNLTESNKVMGCVEVNICIESC